MAWLRDSTVAFFSAVSLMACGGAERSEPAAPLEVESAPVEQGAPDDDSPSRDGGWSWGRPGSVTWAQLVKGSGLDLVQGTAWTRRGELIVLSRSTGEDTDGSATLTLSKYTPWGWRLWTRELRHVSRNGGLGYYDVRNLLGVGPDGSIVLAGFERGTTDLGGGTLVQDVYLAKLDADGTPIWTRSFGGTSLWPRALAVDAWGAIILGGEVSNTVDLGGQTLVREDKAFVARYTPAGDLDWVRAVSPEPRQVYGPRASVDAIAVDGAGNVFAAGNYTGTLFPGGATTWSWTGAPFLIRWDAQGQQVWGKDFGGLEGQVYVAGATPDGHVAAAGRFLGTLAWGGQGVVGDSREYWSSFLVVADVDGQELAARSLREAHVRAMAVDPRGRIYVGGYGPADTDLGGGPMMDSQLEQLFIVRYSLAAEHAWSRTFPNQPSPLGSYIGDRYMRTLSVRPGWGLIAGGNIQLPTDFGGIRLAPEPVPDSPYPPSPDGYLLRLAP
ncbi:hypothetical protein JRI60_51425 [Archangium violaceum]|uniref:hypothetical protein n=1 Tax=Archangium violaceum TaxID=83451 RepID=UPI0019505FD0|nr:hypothetical protein [Archangium violaceum]QRN97267.1 hypothetical protein JRI60_51425 [Archangium violaceum]